MEAFPQRGLNPGEFFYFGEMFSCRNFAVTESAGECSTCEKSRNRAGSDAILFPCRGPDLPAIVAFWQTVAFRDGEKENKTDGKPGFDDK